MMDNLRDKIEDIDKLLARFNSVWEDYRGKGIGTEQDNTSYSGDTEPGPHTDSKITTNDQQVHLEGQCPEKVRCQGGYSQVTSKCWWLGGARPRP